MTDTKFLVLVSLENAAAGPVRQWEEVATVNAKSKEQALRSIGGNAGTYVAVPVRSWQPVRLEVETVQRTKITAAKAEVKA